MPPPLHPHSTKFQELNIREARTLIKEGVISGGMIPKVRARAWV